MKILDLCPLIIATSDIEIVKNVETLYSGNVREVPEELLEKEIATNGILALEKGRFFVFVE